MEEMAGIKERRDRSLMTSFLKFSAGGGVGLSSGRNSKWKSGVIRSITLKPHYFMGTLYMILWAEM